MFKERKNGRSKRTRVVGEVTSYRKMRWETMVSCDWATATSSSNWSTVVTWNTVALP
jgi:hypothetical protein